MRSLTAVVQDALVAERAKGILAVLFCAGFRSLCDEDPDSPHEATVFVRRESETRDLVIVVRIEVMWEDGKLAPYGPDAKKWERVCQWLHACGRWDTAGPGDRRIRVPFVIRVKDTDFRQLRDVPIEEDAEVDDQLDVRHYLAAGWESVAQECTIEAL